MNISIHRNARNGLLLALAAILISACAHRGDDVKGPKTPSYTVPFSISFDRQGDPVVFDQEGNKIPPAQKDLFPVKEVTEIKSMKTVTAIVVKGSCFWLLEAAGKSYQIPLPDSYCVD